VIGIFFRCDKCAELAVNVADVRVINVAIDDVGHDLTAPASVGCHLGQVAPCGWPARQVPRVASARAEARLARKFFRPLKPFPSAHRGSVKPSRHFSAPSASLPSRLALGLFVWQLWSVKGLVLPTEVLGNPGGLSCLSSRLAQTRGTSPSRCDHTSLPGVTLAL